jgi:hypothetical protein
MEDTSSNQNTDSRDRNPAQERSETVAAAPPGGFSIGGRLRMGGEYGVGRRIKKPDWLRSTGSLWEDTQAGTRPTSRDTSRSRNARTREADTEHGVVEEMPHAGRPSIVPELSEQESSIEKAKTREEVEVKAEKSSSSDG